MFAAPLDLDWVYIWRVAMASDCGEEMGRGLDEDPRQGQVHENETLPICFISGMIAALWAGRLHDVDRGRGLGSNSYIFQ